MNSFVFVPIKFIIHVELHRVVSSYREVVEMQKMVASDGADSAAFGISVSMYNHLLAIGAFRDDGSKGIL